MTDQYRTELLTLIEQEFQEYRANSLHDSQLKRDKKAFINGLMTAARIVGISYDELNAIVESTSIKNEQESKSDLSVPAYIRNPQKG